jgi:mono/diheme cytochrome c family protein
MQHQHSNKARPMGLLAVWAAALLLAQPALAKKAAPMPASLKSLSVEMPTSNDIYPDRPGAATLDRNCLACHSSEIVTNQPALPTEVWRSEIDKMRTVYQAQIDPEDIDAIVAYLASINGVPRTKWR